MLKVGFAKILQCYHYRKFILSAVRFPGCDPLTAGAAGRRLKEIYITQVDLCRPHI